MKYRKLGKNGPKVSALGLGCMGMSDHYGHGDEKTSLAVLREAYEQGITFFDTADMYGNGENEKLVGKGIKSFRDQIIVATKCALEHLPDGLRINNKPEYIKAACEGSLKRLGVDKIDLYYLHRYTPEVPLEVSMQAMLELAQEGKINYVGLSEVSPEIIQQAQGILKDKLVAIQSEYSIMNHETAELVLPTCRSLGLAFVAFSPLTRGLLSGKITDRKAIIDGGESDFRGGLPQFEEKALKQNLSLVEAVENFAKQKQCTVAQISLAWLLAQGEDIIPIPGTKRSSYLKENIDALNMTLTKDDLNTLQQIMTDYPIKGGRLPEAMSDFNWK
jgi:aryl-alcohol dehydrogenase-like predicted oxidoreductase